MWSQVPTNKSVGGLFQTTATAMPGATKLVGFPPVLEKAGYKLTTRPLPESRPTISRTISAFKSANAEIITASDCRPTSPRSGNQALRKGFRPKVASIGKAILFPVAVEALGKDGTTFRRKCGGRRTIHSIVAPG